MIKCVVWDIDNTLLSGVYLESEQPPPADPGIRGVAAELGRRGIIHAVASKNPPEAAQHAARVTGLDFAVAECGWGRKSDAVARIAAGLGLGTDALAFVDDDPYERAEVSFELPEVLVLSPEEVTDAPGWPEFSPAVVTAEARRRGKSYAERRRRQQEERAFAGTRDEFLRYCGTEVRISPAAAGDAPRLHELSVRTHQFNSAGAALSEQAFRGLIGSAEHHVTTVRLSDRFGDDGMVGGCVVELGAGRAWTVKLIMMSCRATGRGVIEALLGWLARSAARDGAASLTVPCLISQRNVPLRIALAAAGFRADRAGGSGGIVPPGQHRGPAALFSRPVRQPAPPLPDWVSAPGEP